MFVNKNQTMVDLTSYGKNGQTKKEKHFVRVVADMRPNMQIMPLSIIWEDNRQFKIDDVKDVRQLVVSGLGEQCMAYFIEINKSRRVLYLDKNMQWFIVRPNPSNFDT